MEIPTFNITFFKTLILTFFDHDFSAAIKMDLMGAKSYLIFVNLLSCKIAKYLAEISEKIKDSILIESCIVISGKYFNTD